MIGRALLAANLLAAEAAGVPADDPPAHWAEAAQGFDALHAALHVHSRFSNGRDDLPELAALARRRGIDVLGMADSFLTEVRYGLGPWKKVVSRSLSRPGVRDHGIDAYLQACELAGRAHPGLVLLPGLEVAPHYSWSGDYWSGLTLHDFDRHLLVFGLSDARAIRDLPVIGNERWSNTPKSWSTAAGPLLVLLAGVIVLVAGRPRRVRLLYFRLRSRGRARWIGAALVAASLIWLYDAYPFGRFSDPYSGADETAAYQRLIDYVEERGGLALWSYPEARYPELGVEGARMLSRPHPEDLEQTEGYSGFEGLYGDAITATLAGKVWDRILAAFAAGTRSSWPVAIAGLDYHGTGSGGWKELDRGQTILWCRERSEASVLEALRRGRFYAVFQGEAGRSLTFGDWALGSEGRHALAGETLASPGEVTLSAELAWSPAPVDTALLPVDVEIIRDGALVDSTRVTLPWILRRAEALLPGRHYYRLRAKSGTTELLSSPIFCEIR